MSMPWRSSLEYGELFLFLLVAITYVNTLEERRVFDVLRGWLVGLGLELSPAVLADRRAGLLPVGGAGQPDHGAGDGRGGAGAGPGLAALRRDGLHQHRGRGQCRRAPSRPFGDITTLMVWQKGKLEFFEFFALFVPSLVNWLVPAAIMSFARAARAAAEPHARHGRGPSPARWGVAIAVRADHRHGGRLQELPASAAGAGDDAGPGLSADLVLLPAARAGRAASDADMVLDSFQPDRAGRMGHAAVLLRHHLCGGRAWGAGLPRAGVRVSLRRPRADHGQYRSSACCRRSSTTFR